MNHIVIQKWVFYLKGEALIEVILGERDKPDPTGQELKYLMVIGKGGLEIKRISFDKFHTAMFTFKKTIDTVVRLYEQNIDGEVDYV